MERKMNGLSRELIFHPGDTLREVLEDRGMSQRELALRTGFSAKHVSEVLNGIAPVSTKFASALELVLGVDAEFWLNLQNNYDIELLEYSQKETVTEAELWVLHELRDVIKYMKNVGLLPVKTAKQECVLLLRRFFAINDLTTIPNVAFSGAFRGSTSAQINIYVLFAWQRICELSADRIELTTPLDAEKLKLQLPYIKSLMFLAPNEMQKKLQCVFAECGIKFCIVKHFAGAPVQGFIEENKNGEIILCMTIRQAYADIFWFTLFHEIAHILNGDIKRRFIDFTFTHNEEEALADKFAGEQLLREDNYQRFIQQQNFSLSSIKIFARSEKVQPFIVIGRLQKEKLLPYNVYSKEKTRYVWSNK